jgi:hypothetical protein
LTHCGKLIHSDVRLLAASAVILALCGCHHCCRPDRANPPSPVTAFLSPNPPPTDSGRYKGRFEILTAAHPVAVKMAPLRADAEAHENVMRKLLRDRFQVRQPLEFRYMFTGYDSLNNKAVLRFFARAADQKEIAGWQLQFIYDYKTLRPIHAYVMPLPLE